MNVQDLHYLDAFNQYKLAAKLSFYVWQLLVLVSNFVLVLVSILIKGANAFTFVAVGFLVANTLLIVTHFILEIVLQKKNLDSISNAINILKKIINITNMLLTALVLASAFFLKVESKVFGWILGIDITILVLFTLLLVLKISFKLIAKKKMGNIQELLSTLNKK